MVNPFVTLFPYSCLTACAIAGRLPKYCAFSSTNCWNKPQVLCARATIRDLSVSFYTLQRAHCTPFSLSNQVIYASSRCLQVRSFRIKQTLLRYYMIFLQPLDYCVSCTPIKFQCSRAKAPDPYFPLAHAVK